MYEVGVFGHFQASHALVGDFGPASELHTHDYRVEVAVRGRHLKPDGTLVDITILNTALAAVTQRLDQRHLNEVLGLSGHNTTAEAIAKFVFDEIRQSMPLISQVRVWKSSDAYAAYDGSDLAEEDASDLAPGGP
jgi:6-pyruvoyltetrahydropterin/6-carboxytetrahydropterin synthase